MKKNYFVYIMTNKSYTLYIGVTHDPARRIREHKYHFADGFTKRYNINKLIYLEEYGNINEAIVREKQIKSWSRKKKIQLIKTVNPNFEEITL